jgi:hypothetical protein
VNWVIIGNWGIRRGVRCGSRCALSGVFPVPSETEKGFDDALTRADTVRTWRPRDMQCEQKLIWFDFD